MNEQFEEYFDDWFIDEFGRTQECEDEEWIASFKRAMIAGINYKSTSSVEIALPQTEDEAVGMWLIGEAWVKQNAPHRLKEGRQSEDKLGVVPEGWQQKILDAMDKGFSVRREHGKHHDDALINDDTQLGVEFAIEQLEAMLSASPAPDSEGE